jgi:hypothetical protein
MMYKPPSLRSPVHPPAVKVGASPSSDGRRFSFSPRILFFLVAVALAVLGAASGCSHKVGDGCSTSADCDPTRGSRTCDLAQPGGYCIVEGCDARSCPEDSVCVRFFPESFLSEPCDPQRPATDNGCTADELCLDVGLCARRSLERRACVQSCGGDGDCRGGYECRLAGARGSMALVLDPEDKMPRFCAPR